MNKDKEQFEVQDKRHCTRYFWINHRVFVDYMKVIGKSGFIVYCSLAHHANSKSQKAWPSNACIAKETSLHERTVRRSLKKLVEYNLTTKRTRKGKTNVYTLLEPKNRGGANCTPVPDAPPTPVPDAPLIRTNKEEQETHTVSTRSELLTDSDGAALSKDKKHSNANRASGKRGSISKLNKKVECDAAATDSHVKSKKMIITEFDWKMSERLFEIVREQKKISKNHSKWPDVFRRLRNDIKPISGNKEAKKRIKEVLVWYSVHVGEEFVVEIECAQSFRRKFTRLEGAIKRYNKANY